MSLELVDYRCKITTEAFCAIAAYARAHDMDKGEVAREVLHRWALRQIQGASMLANCLRAKGMTAAAEGISAASQGTSGNSGLNWDES